MNFELNFECKFVVSRAFQSLLTASVELRASSYRPGSRSWPGWPRGRSQDCRRKQNLKFNVVSNIRHLSMIYRHFIVPPSTFLGLLLYNNFTYKNSLNWSHGIFPSFFFHHWMGHQTHPLHENVL